MFRHKVHFCVQEDGITVTVGGGCKFSNHITVSTSDVYPINNGNKERINPAKTVIIGDGVRIALNTKIMKGPNIGDGAIIGFDSMIGNKPITAHYLAFGLPAKTR